MTFPYDSVMIMKSEFKYVGIRVTNLQRSIAFYTRVLGMKIAHQGEIKQARGKTVALQTGEDGFVLELNYYEEDSPYNTKYTGGEGLDHLAFKVEDLDKALEEAKKAGHPTVLEMKSDGRRWVYIEDPDGIWIELF